MGLLTGPTGDQLMDGGEVAALLGITADSLRAMRARPDRHPGMAGLPEPLRTVSGRPVWLREHVEAWAENR